MEDKIFLYEKRLEAMEKRFQRAAKNRFYRKAHEACVEILKIKSILDVLYTIRFEAEHKEGE